MKKWMIRLAPVLLLLLCGIIAFLLVKFRREPKADPPDPPVPSIEVIEVQPQTRRLMVRSQGTVAARRSTMLSAEVSGRIVDTSDDFVAGGFFDRGEVLVSIDPVDYETALAEAESRLAQARLALEQEEARSRQARREWDALGRGEASPLTLRKPQLARARADVNAAEAAVARAERNLERTRVKAPYDGRVREILADIGDVVAGPSTPLARIYSTDYAEIRLPIEPRETAFLHLPGEPDAGGENEPPSPVLLSAEIGRGTQVWTGTLHRTEGVIDPRNRLIPLVARVDRPYEPQGGNRVPLKVGQFVRADIVGKTIEDAIVIPRAAVFQSDKVLVVKPDNTLERRTVTVLKTNEDDVILSGGLEAGERISLTTVEFYVKGMSVDPLPQGPTGEDAARP